MTPKTRAPREDGHPRGRDKSSAVLKLASDTPTGKVAGRKGLDTSVLRMASGLRMLIRAEMDAALQEALGGISNSGPKLLDRTGLGEALDVSTVTVDKLRREPGFPTYWVLESPRFDLAEVRRWLASRNGSSA